jgi:hypothetical protein
MQSIARDPRYAVRALRSSPGCAAIAIRYPARNESGGSPVRETGLKAFAKPVAASGPSEDRTWEDRTWEDRT